MTKVKINSIDAIRTICILAVVAIHTTTRTLESTNYNLYQFPFTLFLNQISRFAVPLFILISGFVLELNYHFNMNYVEYFKKRATKIVIPYIFWSFVYYFFVYKNNQESIVNMLITGSASYQLYFIPTLCIYYLLFPLLHKIYDLLTNKFVFILLFFFQLKLMYADYFIHQFAFIDPIRIFLLSYLYFILGMIFARNQEVLLRLTGKIKYLLILAIAPIVHYIFKEGISRYYQIYNIETFYSQWRTSVFSYSILLFIFFYYFFAHKGRQLRVFNNLSKLSYFVFFIHVIVLETVWKYSLSGIFYSLKDTSFVKVFFDPLFFLSTAVLSFLIAKGVHKVKFLQKITG